MSSDGEQQPQPSKRKRLVISDSDSSEGTTVVRGHRKRRVYEVVSDPETTDDDSDVAKPLRRRKNHRVVSEDEASSNSSGSNAGGSSQVIDDSTGSEWQSDWESASDESDSDSIEYKRPSKAFKPTKSPKKFLAGVEASSSNAGCESDVSDGQSEKCPICLLPFTQQEVATPSSCEHCFCLFCLMEWSKNINTCPVDRQAFTVIHVRSNLGGNVVRHVPVQVKTNVEETIQEDPTYCEVCHQCDREDRMLLCDGCDLGYHLECLDPPINEVPMDEWYCPECSRNSQDDAESVPIDLDEIPDLMAEARGLGVSYGRTRTGIPRDIDAFGPHRLIPRTRQIERVRANIRADRTRAREVPNADGNFDPDQPSTSSSGIESISENSRSRSPNGNSRSRVRSSTVTAAPSSRNRAKTTRKAKKKRKVPSNGERMVREVRIIEVNDDGEEEEIVTYVNVAPASTKKGRKTKRSRKKRRRKKGRRARTVSSMAAAISTAKKRLANTLGMVRPDGSVNLSGPSVKVQRTPSVRGALNDSRFRAGISQVSLFGSNLGINYSPPGSDDEFDSASGDGPLVSVHRRSAVSATRRRLALKAIANPVTRQGDANQVVDLIGSIINSQELWHSKKNTGIILKADGTLLIENKNQENKQSVNNNESPVKKKENTSDAEVPAPALEKPLDLSSVNPSDITQAPMYNSPRGGGNRGNFRGGYRDGSRHSQGGHGYGGRDSYSGGGRHSYGGTGSRDNFGNREFGPPANYNPNFDHRGQPPFGGTPPFRNRNPQHFRPDRQRMPMPDRPMFPPPMEGLERPPFPHPNHFPRPRIPLGISGPPPGPSPGLLRNMPGPMGMRPPIMPREEQRQPPQIVHDNFPTNSQEPRETFGPHQLPPPAARAPTPDRAEDEECDIYCDIEAPNKSDSDHQDESGNESTIALPPPPEPPSGLLDFDEDNSKSDKDNDSDQDLVIDDTPKEDTSRGLIHDDKYDPFAADSDTNDSDRGRNHERVDKKSSLVGDKGVAVPLDPPPMPSEFLTAITNERSAQDTRNPLLRLTAYDDDDDEDSQDDCPNFSIYSSATMDVARHTEQELSQQIGPLEPPPLPPDVPDDDDVIVGDVQTCDLADIPEPSDPYVEALRKERQTLSRIPPKKISNDARGKITFKIGNKFKLNNKLSNLYDELDENIEVSIEQERELEEKKNVPIAIIDTAKKGREVEKDDEIFPTEDIRKDKEEKRREKKSPEELRNESDEEANDKLERNKAEVRIRDGDGDGDNSHRKPGGSIRENAKHSDEEDEEDEDVDGKKKTAKEARVDSAEEDDEDGENRVFNREAIVVKETLAMSTIDLTEKSNDSIISITETVQSSPKKSASGDGDVDRTPERRRRRRIPIGDAASDDDKSDERSERDDSEEKIGKSRKSRKRSGRIDGSPEVLSDIEDRSSDNDGETKDAAKTSYSSSLDQARAGASSSFDVDDETENFPLEKEIIVNEKAPNVADDQGGWESDGAYTPCKDERPVKEKENRGSLSPFESGLEPITPTKDRANDDLDGCRTPVGYAGLGTEAISETDEPMNFEDELTMLSLRKEKDMEDGEIMDDGKVSKKHNAKSAETDEVKRKRKKEKKEKSKETEKNKENISSENQVAWKKISKSTKDRQYRDKDKRSRSRERDKEKDREKEKEKDKDKDKEKEKAKPKKKVKEAAKKKEKRKELARYDVRKIVAEKPARPRKDEYGRDIRENSRSKSRSKSASRQRSLSRERRSRSYSRVRSRSHSRSRARRSWSRNRRSLSKSRRSLSKGRRSVSRRRSLSRIRRKRSTSPRQRSLSKKRSVSRRRSKSAARRRRSLSPRRRRRSLSRKHRSRSREKRKEKAKKHKSRSRSRNRKRSRSKSPKRAISKSREKKHAKRKASSRSRSKHRSVSRDRNRNWNTVSDKPVERDRNFAREKEQRKSWSAQWTPSWSRSNTPVLNQREELPTRTWSPPPALDGVTVPPKNLTVILTNKEAIKKKRKDKRKESKKTRGETDRRRKTKRTRTPPPSKEVFASGDNILVSVCFNKENETTATGLAELPETIPLIATGKRRRREPIQTEPAKKPKKDKAKEKRAKSPKTKKERKKKSKAAEIAATKKPVAVIDLDQSPFREQTPSPRDVIVLSDDDDKQVQELATPEQHASSQLSPQHDQFVSQGPKTPPEPQIKFPINKQTSNLRPSMMNPLLEEEEEEEEEIDERVEEELEMRAQEELELRLKIGPNTPPEPPSSPPTSPDAYDPFDPTKSRSPTPTASQDATPNDERDRNQRNNSPRKHDTGDETLTPGEPTQAQDQANPEKQQAEKPKIISMVTIKRASPKRDTSPVVDSQTEVSQILDSPTKAQQNQQNAQSSVNPFATINPVLATVAAAVQRSAIFNTSTPIAGQRNLQQPNRISPSTQMKQRAIDRPQLPNLFANAPKPTPIRMQKTLQNKNMSTMGQNGSDATLDLTNDMVVDMSSPYSPGSSLSDGIFDPPSPGNHNGSPANISTGNKIGTAKNNKTAEKKDAFDVLFGSSPAMKPTNKARTKKTNEKEKRNKKSTNPKVGVRMDENQLQILDDLPSSAVEMQVKDKFLKKLNRQERVVEEVKLVLKPHYTKKHVTKDEYKDIMRKAVPKICHNKTGEINPKKIAQLIEAYVKKCRSSKKKKLPVLPMNSTGKTVKPVKNLWS